MYNTNCIYWTKLQKKMLPMQSALTPPIKYKYKYKYNLYFLDELQHWMLPMQSALAPPIIPSFNKADHITELKREKNKRYGRMK